MGTRRDPLGVSAWRNMAHRILIASRVPVHSVLVQKSVATITNSAGRLSPWMLGNSLGIGKRDSAKRWHLACIQSNAPFTRKYCLTKRNELVCPRCRPDAGCFVSSRHKTPPCSHQPHLTLFPFRPITCSRQHDVAPLASKPHSQLMQSSVRIFRRNTQQVSAV